MKLEIVAVHNRGNADKEYVMLRATDDLNIKYYLLADTTYLNDGAVSNKLRHIFWFPDKRVKKGEYVSVWTRKGKSTAGVAKDGSPVHRFFWNLEKAVWNDDKDRAVLIEANAWSVKAVQ